MLVGCKDNDATPTNKKTGEHGGFVDYNRSRSNQEAIVPAATSTSKGMVDAGRAACGRSADCVHTQLAHALKIASGARCPAPPNCLDETCYTDKRGEKTPRDIPETVEFAECDRVHMCVRQNPPPRGRRGKYYRTDSGMQSVSVLLAFQPPPSLIGCVYHDMDRARRATRTSGAKR